MNRIAHNKSLQPTAGFRLPNACQHHKNLRRVLKVAAHPAAEFCCYAASETARQQMQLA